MTVTRVASLAIALAGATIVLMSCTDSVSPATLPSETAQRVDLPLGHCWIDPIEIDGIVWGIDTKDQFGWGGGATNWSGTGVIHAVADNHLVYADDNGRRVDLRPLGDPRVFDPQQEKALCA